MALAQKILERCQQNAAQVDSVFQKRLVHVLAKDLVSYRGSVFASLGDFMRGHLAKWISGSKLPLSYRRRMRFLRSAARRSADRSLTLAGLCPPEGAGTGGPDAQQYQRWIDEEESRHSAVPQSTASHSVCFVVPVGQSTDQDALRHSLDALEAQTGAVTWHVAFVQSAPVSEAAQAVIDEFTGRHGTSFVCQPQSLKEDIKDDFIALLMPGDRLAGHALAGFMSAVADTPTLGLVYSDHDTLQADGRRSDPCFKNGWNRDLLYSANYIGRFALVARAHCDPLWSALAAGAMELEHAALIAVTANLADGDIAHVPMILCHQSPAASEVPPVSTQTIETAIRTCEASDVVLMPGSAPGTYRPIWPVPDPEPSVCLIIPTRDRKSLVETAVTSILDITGYRNFSVIIVDNGSVEPATTQWFDHITATEARVRVLACPGPFNYAALNNAAVKETDADIIGLLNNDVEVIHEDWLREMVSHALRSDIGCVGAKLHYSDTSVQHAGVSLGIGPVAGHIFSKQPGMATGYLDLLQTVRNVSAVTGACLVMRRELYSQLGGFDAENLAVTCNDVDLCLRANAAGFRSLWTPYAQLFHHESASRGQDEDPQKKERLKREQNVMIERWDLKPGRDAYVNPNVFNWI